MPARRDNKVSIGGVAPGLLSLAERVQLAGGHSAIESAPGGGATVRAWFPLKDT